MLTDLKPVEFYAMTYRQFFIYMDCYTRKRQEQSDFDMSLSWYSAYFQRVKKMPKLSDVLSKKPPKKEQSEKEMFDTIKDFAVSMGAEIF